MVAVGGGRGGGKGEVWALRAAVLARGAMGTCVLVGFFGFSGWGFGGMEEEKAGGARG